MTSSIMHCESVNSGSQRVTLKISEVSYPPILVESSITAGISGMYINK